MSATTVSMSNCRRPHVGHAIRTGPRSRSLSALRISQATLTSSSAWKVDRLMRIVSPMPSASSVPSPTADLSDPDHFVPASVTPRCSGYGMRSASRRFEAIVFGTLVDFIETLKFSKSRRSMSSTYSTAARTSASTGLENSRSRRCLGSEPEFTPMRSGVPSAFAFATTSAVLSGPPMLPGLIRTQCAPASSDLSASVWLKWMSAITGIGDSATIVRRASTSRSRGTATRTTSAPASATRRIWSIVAVRFAVSVFVMVCTTTGAPPPTWTPPTFTCRWEAIPLQSRSGAVNAGTEAGDAIRTPSGRPARHSRVHALDLGGVLLADRLALELHRRRQLVAARQPVAGHDREPLDLLDARQLLVAAVDRLLHRGPDRVLACQLGQRAAFDAEARGERGGEVGVEHDQRRVERAPVADHRDLPDHRPGALERRLDVGRRHVLA